MQTLHQTLRSRFGVGSVDPLLLAGALLFAQSGGASIPVVDLAGQPRANLSLNLVYLCQFFVTSPRPSAPGPSWRWRSQERAVSTPPASHGASITSATAARSSGGDRPVVEVGRRAAVRSRPVRLEVDELEALRDRSRVHPIEQRGRHARRVRGRQEAAGRCRRRHHRPALPLGREGVRSAQGRRPRTDSSSG